MNLKNVKKLFLESAQEYKKAKEIADELVELLKPVTTKIEIVGSLARYHPLVNDIDLVIVPKAIDITNYLKEKNIKIISGDKKVINFFYKNILVNVWLTDKSSFLFTVLHFSAGKAIIQLKKKANSLDYTLNRYGLYKNGEKIEVHNLDELFNILQTTTKFYKIKMLEKAIKNLNKEQIEKFIKEKQFPRETDTYYRFRQIEPHFFDKTTFKIKKQSNGNAFIIGKKNNIWEIQSVLINKKNISKNELKSYLQSILKIKYEIDYNL